MTSSINLKKIISVGAAALLAIGGSLTASTSSSAAEVTNITLGGGAHIQSSMTSISLGAAGCNSYIGTTNNADWSLTSTGGQTLTTVSLMGYMVIGLSAPLSGGETVTITYTKNVSRLITCGNGDTVGSFTFSDTAPVMIPPTLSSGSTSSLGNTSVTLNYTIDMVANYYYTVRDASAPAPTASFVAAANWGASDLKHGAGAIMSSGPKTISVTGLSAGNAYKAYIAAQGAGGLSNLLTINFTTTGGVSISFTSNPSYSITNGVATANDGTWSGAGTAIRFWVLCDTAHNASASSPHSDCYPVALTQNGTDEQSSTFTPTTNVWMGFSGSRTQVAFASKFLGLFVNVNSGAATYMTATSAGAPVASVSAPALTPEQARNQIKPLPVIVQPLVAAIPVLNKPMVNAGGKLDLSAGDFSGLVSASISGKPLDLTLGAKGGLTITVPNGEAGKTADLFLKFSTGTVIIQDAIKYVAPVVVADVPTRPVSIAAGSTKLSQETADQVRQAAFANMKNTTVSCVAYAANGSAAARAAAQASAEQVCALAVKSNPALTATPVTVVVDKAKAKTEAVGIKVYKN